MPDRSEAEWRAFNQRESRRIERERAALRSDLRVTPRDGWSDDPGPEPGELTGSHVDRARMELDRRRNSSGGPL